MVTRCAIALLFPLTLVACSGSSIIDDGTGGATSVGAGASGGGTGATGGSPAGGNGGSGGVSVECPDIGCAKTCPAGTVVGSDGCPTCVCSAQLEMEIRGMSKPTQLVTLDTQVTDFIGGINRWIFDFTWTYDDPGVSDDAEEVVVTVALMRTDPMHEPSADMVSWCHPEDAGMPLESRGATYTLYGFGVIMSDLVLDDGFLSIARVGDNFEGFAYFDLSVVGGGGTDVMHVAAPFTVAVP